MIPFYQDFLSSQIDSYIHSYPTYNPWNFFKKREIDKISKMYVEMPRSLAYIHTYIYLKE